MGRSRHRGRIPATHAGAHAKLARRVQPQRKASLPRLRCTDRKSLLLGTALASTLLVSALVTPSPAWAVFNCPVGTGPVPLNYTKNEAIICVNAETRIGTAFAIQLITNNSFSSIDLSNSGTLTATNAGDAYGINTVASEPHSPISIVNISHVAATSTGSLAFAFMR
jgi:autotransporter family porin